MRIVILLQIVLFVLLVIHNIRFGSDLIWSPWY